VIQHPLEARPPWEGRRVVLGVTGGIAAYKSVQLARDLTRLGAEVDVVLSRSASRFVQPLSFEGVTGRDALIDLFSSRGAALHISLGLDAQTVCVAPATADFLARAAQGRADDLLTTTLLATRAPVVVCPAMNDRMFSHPAVQDNLSRVAAFPGWRVAGPGVGPLAVGEGEGPGRMLEPWEIVEHVGRALGEEPAFRGRRVLVTAGPTREPLDPVRYLGNRSSGRMGYALAAAAWRRGAEVTLVSGPTALPDPVGVRTLRVGTAREMDREVREVIPGADVAVFAAAVADFRPSNPSKAKMKRDRGAGEEPVHLESNPDVAGGTRELRREGSVAVGFALETEDLLANAAKKLAGKGFHLLVANSATREGSGFEVATNQVTILDADGGVESLPLLSKDRVAERILDRISALRPEWSR